MVAVALIVVATYQIDEWYSCPKGIDEIITFRLDIAAPNQTNWTVELVGIAVELRDILIEMNNGLYELDWIWYSTLVINGTGPSTWHVELSAGAWQENNRRMWIGIGEFTINFTAEKNESTGSIFIGNSWSTTNDFDCGERGFHSELENGVNRPSWRYGSCSKDCDANWWNVDELLGH